MVSQTLPFTATPPPPPVADTAHCRDPFPRLLCFLSRSYRAALREFPSPACPAEVRLGIGACALKLGDSATAKAAFTRALELDPDSADGYAGLAVLAASDAGNAQQVGLDLDTHGQLLGRYFT
jgi:hypothetical protein